MHGREGLSSLGHESASSDSHLEKASTKRLICNLDGEFDTN